MGRGKFERCAGYKDSAPDGATADARGRGRYGFSNRTLLDALPHFLNRRIFAGAHLIIFVSVQPDYELRVRAEILPHHPRGRLDGFRVALALQRVMAAGGIKDIGISVISDDGPIRESERFDIKAGCLKHNESASPPGFCAHQLPGADHPAPQFVFFLRQWRVQDVIFHRIILLQFGQFPLANHLRPHF